MHAPSAIAPDEPLTEIEKKIAHTWIVLLACQLTKGMAPPFERLLAELEMLRPIETKLDRAVKMQEELARIKDDVLNVLLDDTKKEVLIEVGNDYTAALYTQIFKVYTPSQLRRFLLNEQLETMRTWPAILLTTSNARLHSIAARIVEAVKQADEVLSALAAATAEQTAFALGPLATFAQSCTAARGAAFGKLLEMSEDPASGPLPEDFVDRFFQRDSSGRALRLDDLNAAITQAAERLARLTAQRDELAGKQERARKAKLTKELVAKKARFAAKTKDASDEAAAIAALEAELAKNGEA
jgi:hypothetical protein